MQEEYCLSCDYEEELKPRHEPTTVVVCGKEFQVTKEFYQCPGCGKAFISSLGHSALDEAYRKYRKRHGMLLPEGVGWRCFIAPRPPRLAHVGWTERSEVQH